MRQPAGQCSTQAKELQHPKASTTLPKLVVSHGARAAAAWGPNSKYCSDFNDIGKTRRQKGTGIFMG